MRILVLGGTAFVGRAIVEDFLRSGAEITLFGRGKTGTALFPGAVRLRGDRDTGDYAALRDGTWDAVVDVSGYVPRHVGQAMDALTDALRRVRATEGERRAALRAFAEEQRERALKPAQIAATLMA